MGPNQAVNGGASAIVAASNGVPIVAERTVYYASPPWGGIETEVGARSTSDAWVLPPSVPDVAVDRLLLVNPGADAASISVTLYRADGAPITPKSLQGVELRPGLRKELSLDGIEGAGRMIAVIRSTVPVVAERLTMSTRLSDVASVMGIVLGGPAEEGQADAT
jgi:hypothetical protein